MKLHVYSYLLHAKKPLHVGSNTIEQKQGLTLLLADGSNILGVGEISPLPFWSRESIAETLSELDRVLVNKSDLKVLRSKGFFAELRWQKLQGTLSPSTSWALYNIFKGGIAQWTHTRVNALASLESDDDVVSNIIELEKKGYTSVKLKIQKKHIDFQADTLREVFGRTQRILVRLDANQSLSVKDVQILLKDQPHFRFEYFEEPIVPTGEYFSDLKSLQEEFKIDYAFDETLLSFTKPLFDLSVFLRNLKKNRISAHFILKPMLLGARVTQIANTLTDLNMKCIISSTYESPVGLFTNSRLLEGQNNIDMGLDTPPFDMDWSLYVQKNGPSIRIQKNDIVKFCRNLEEVRTYDIP